MEKKRIAIVTGANGGLGREFVRLLTAEEGISEIWAVGRSREKLHELEKEFGDKIRIFALDLTDRENYTAIERALREAEVKVSYLVNCAGYAKFCSYDDINIEEALNMIDLNAGALTAMGMLCIPYMERGSHLVNIASQASFFPLPYVNVYSSTKAYVRNYTRALNVELKGTGIKATAVCPGWMSTPFLERGDIGAKKAPRNYFAMDTPDVVAARAMRDVSKGKDISTYGWFVKLSHVGSKLFSQKFIMKLWLRMQKIK